MAPKVSVTILTYNRARFLRESLESALAQTFKNTEIIVADDASIDETPRLVREFTARDKRIVSLRNEKNMGRLKFRPRVLARARGEYIAVLDDDDVWQDPAKLEKQVNFLDEHPEYVACGTGALLVSEEGKALYPVVNPETDSEIRRFILSRNPFFASSMVLRKDGYEKVGGYDPNVIASEDHDLWLRLGRIGKLYNFAIPAIKYRTQVKNPYRPWSSKALIRLVKKYGREYPGYYPALLRAYLRLFYFMLPRPSWLDMLLLRLRYAKKLKI